MRRDRPRTRLALLLTRLPKPILTIDIYDKTAGSHGTWEVPRIAVGFFVTVEELDNDVIRFARLGKIWIGQKQAMAESVLYMKLGGHA